MKKLPLLILIILSVGVLTMVGRSRRSYDTEAKAKADYIYLEALRAKSQEKYDAAYELLSRAHEINPTDRSIGAELSMYLLTLSSDTATVERSVDLLKAYCDENPDDAFYAVRYAVLSEELGRKDDALKVWRRLHDLNPDKIEFTLRLAESLSSGGDASQINEAIAIYDSIEAAEGQNIAIASRKIRIYYAQGDTAAIIDEVDRTRAAAPNSVEHQVFSGEMYLLMGQKERAKEFFDSACIIDPSSGMAYYSRARYYHTIGDSAAFEHEVFEALRQKDLDVDTKLAMLKGYVQEMYTDSLRQPNIRSLFDELIEQHPHEHDIHQLYAQYFIAIKDYADAAAQTEQALDADPSDSNEWELLVSLNFQIEDNAKAKEAILHSLRYYPDNPRMYLMLGAIFSQDKDYDKALKELSHALELVDTNDVELMSQIYQSIGDNHYQLGEKGEAFAAYASSLTYNPTNYLALNNCAYHLALEGRDIDKALEMIEKVIKAEPDNDTALDTYAWVLFKRKDYALAREIIDRTLELTEQPGAEVLEHAGDIYYMDGEPEKALEFWERALELDSDNALLKKKVTNKAYYFK